MAAHMREQSNPLVAALRSGRMMRWLTIPVVFVVASFTVWQSSNAAFTATTTNDNNAWSVGSVSLTDDDVNGTMFNVSGLKPGSTGSKCILVTYGGTLTSNVKMYASNGATTNSLSSYIDLTIQEGNTGNFAACGSFVSTGTIYTGTLANFITNQTSYANGSGTWAPTGSGQTRLYRVQYTVNASTPNSAQGGTAGVRFNWEAQNT